MRASGTTGYSVTRWVTLMGSARLEKRFTTGVQPRRRVSTVMCGSKSGTARSRKKYTCNSRASVAAAYWLMPYRSRKRNLLRKDKVVASAAHNRERSGHRRAAGSRRDGSRPVEAGRATRCGANCRPPTRPGQFACSGSGGSRRAAWHGGSRRRERTATIPWRRNSPRSRWRRRSEGPRPARPGRRGPAGTFGAAKGRRCNWQLTISSGQSTVS